MKLIDSHDSSAITITRRAYKWDDESRELRISLIRYVIDKLENAE